ncbi:CBS and ACT domain-containing protein [Magnetococcus sp. PR-3]|uniref:CBS and ACT domain-containing protein n=1 Tax=Magnetococcus sp. PR-3 TaxID=3120355 RepID=UPI002FCE336C
MYVDRIMTLEVVAIAPTATWTEMNELMRTRRFHHLPVVEDGALVGVVTSHDLERAQPSAVTTLSVSEANYLLSKVTAQTIMEKAVVTTGPKTLIEEAGVLMREKEIGFLPVLNAHDQLVGVVTQSDLMDFFLDVTGSTLKESARIAMHLSDAPGKLTELLGRINALGGYIATVVSPLHPDKTGLRIVIIRFKAANPQALVKALEDRGYDMISEDM